MWHPVAVAHARRSRGDEDRQHVENEQFRVGWFAGRRRRRGSPRRFGFENGSTVVPANIFQETSEIEVVAGRVECDGRMGRAIRLGLPIDEA